MRYSDLVLLYPVRYCVLKRKNEQYRYRYRMQYHIRYRTAYRLDFVYDVVYDIHKGLGQERGLGKRRA